MAKEREKAKERNLGGAGKQEKHVEGDTLLSLGLAQSPPNETVVSVIQFIKKALAFKDGDHRVGIQSDAR